MKAAYLLVILLSFLDATVTISSFINDFKNTIENTYSDLSSKVPEAVEGLWKQVEGLGDDTVQFAHKILAENTDLGMDKIEELTSKIHGSINATRTFVGELQGALEKRGSDLTAFVMEFSEEIEKLSEISKLELRVPPLESREEHYEWHNRQVAFVLNMTENALVKVCKHRDIPEAEVREKFSSVKETIQHVVIYLGNLIERHPILLEFILFLVTSLIVMVFSGALFFGVFIRLFGVSSSGPIKGSLAAWAQSLFFGATVRKGSWFSVLQSAAMKKGL